MEQEEKVIIYDPSCGYFWKAESKGYTTAAEKAGLYSKKEAEKIKRGTPERNLEIISPPPDNIIILKALLRRIYDLNKELTINRGYLHVDSEMGRDFRKALDIT